MKHAEIIYETGSKSIVSYDDLKKLKDGLNEQHRRATRGNPGGPLGHSAERIKKVLLYDSHPGDLYESGLLPVEVLKTQVPDLIDSVQIGGQVSVWELINKLRELISPLTKAEDTGAHDSMHLAVETESLDLAFLEDGEE